MDQQQVEQGGEQEAPALSEAQKKLVVIRDEVATKYTRDAADFVLILTTLGALGRDALQQIRDANPGPAGIIAAVRGSMAFGEVTRNLAVNYGVSTGKTEDEALGEFVSDVAGWLRRAMAVVEEGVAEEQAANDTPSEGSILVPGSAAVN